MARQKGIKIKVWEQREREKSPVERERESQR